MCGIAGLISLDGSTIDEDSLRRVNNELAHRGPDGDGIFCNAQVGLAHRRLAIIDPRLGIQPFIRDGIVLTFNGEIYNYVEIRKELESRCTFSTHSDTEVLIRAFQIYGIECLRHFRGMFAFAIYDPSQHVVYIVRDRLGIKPLYYYQDSQQLAFASELTSLLELPAIPRRINPAAVSAYFNYQYVPTPLSIYDDIHKLEPGAYLRIDLDSGHVDKQQYWQMDVNVHACNEAEALEELNSVLDETIRIYTRSDVPFGAFLSGGVDSSLVTAIMSKHLSDPVRTFTIAFREEQHSEARYAAEVSRILGTQHTETTVTFDMALDKLQLFVRHFGEPFSDSSAIPTYFVSQAAAAHVKMVLSGDGGDELFGGYNSYADIYKTLSTPMLTHLANAARPFISLLPSMRAQQFVERRSATLAEQHRRHRVIFDDNALAKLLVRSVDASCVSGIRRGAIDPITQFQVQDVQTYLVDDVLTKVDRMSMANSLEVRVPLLDHVVVELAFRLPLALKLKAMNESRLPRQKHLLKRSAERFFSPAFLDRPKQGFGIPIHEWCQGAFKEPLRELAANASDPIYEWIVQREVKQLFANFFAGATYEAGRVWAVWMFAQWMQTVHNRTHEKIR